MKDHRLAAEALLSLLPIKDPTIQQRVGARLVARFINRVSNFLAPKG